MQQVLRRIAIHGGLTALFLAVLGVVLAEIASTVFLAPTGRAGEDPAALEAMTREMRTNLPLMMAMWGFGILAVAELVRHLVTSGRKPVAPPPAPSAPPAPDEAEKLLEELLFQAESKTSAARGTGGPSPAPSAGEALPAQSVPAK